MRSNANEVTAYLREVPQSRQACLAELRRLCLEILPDHEEGMDYGMPCYKKNGVVEVAFASQKNYISLYIPKQDVLDANRDLLVGLSVGKDCIRYTKPHKIDFELVRKLLTGTALSGNAPC